VKEKNDKIKVAILKALHDIDGAAGAARISEVLAGYGINLQPRTVRFYLLLLDKEGLTRFVTRRHGRELTDSGREELAHSNVMEKVGFVAAKVDTLGYRMTFNLAKGTGTIITNIAVISKRDLARSLVNMEPVFARNLGMGQKITIVREGHNIGGYKVPRDSVGFGTVCSVTVNGIMLNQGVPVTSRFGGLVEIRDGEPMRFVELIEYGGTTIDPLEAFIRAGMTQVRECARTNSGIIGASFREVPSVALDDVRRIRQEMSALGLSGILAIGKPNRPLLDIPVAEGRTGMIVVGGLNPIAALREAGIPVNVQSLAGLEDFGNFSSFKDVAQWTRPRNTYVE
jgi:HTH-type transcriptional regulator, global nitrogen regulator NrpRI